MQRDHRIEPWHLGMWINGGWAYFALNEKDHIHWTTDKNEALQFARSQDVARLIARYYGDSSKQLSPIQ